MIPRDPNTVHPPLGAYTHAIEVPSKRRLLFLSGQIGIAPDGTLADGIENQLRQVWRNIAAILSDARLKLADIVHVTTYVTRTDHLAVHGLIRKEVLGTHRPAATGLCVTALAMPEVLCEVQVVAAAPE
jgi:2-iminobutanoate/2-iminopropanoate deaminase